jgi:hypothetical protein
MKRVLLVVSLVVLGWLAGLTEIMDARAATVLNCGWCGSSCQEVISGIQCADVAPPTGLMCVSEGGACVAKAGGEYEEVIDKPVCTKCGDGCVWMKQGQGGCMAPGSGFECMVDGNDCLQVFAETSTVTPEISQPVEDISPAPTEILPETTEVAVDENSCQACATRSKGDANCDGVVKLGDFVQWKKEYLGVEMTKKADFSCDGNVGIEDFVIWKKGYLGII